MYLMPLTAAEARKLIRRLLDAGTFVVVQHARDEMKKDNLTVVDAVNILRGCPPKEPESENGAWRYKVSTPRMVFVVEFDPEPEVAQADVVDIAEMELVVVTAWRVRR
jgi:hypothetical protein